MKSTDHSVCVEITLVESSSNENGGLWIVQSDWVIVSVVVWCVVQPDQHFGPD